MSRKKLKRKGQFVISVALLIAIIAMTAALSIYLASMLHHRFRYKSYKEIVNSVDSDFERALTNALSKATHEYIGIKAGGEIDFEHATYNYTALRLSAQNFMDFWKQTVVNSYAGTGLEINIDHNNRILLQERREDYYGRKITIPERWLYNLTKAYWFYPESISAIGAGLSLNITGMGFYGFKSNKTIYLILSIDVNDLREQGEEYQHGGKPIDHIKVKVLKEGKVPVHDLTSKNFFIRVFDLYTGSWRKADILSVSYEGDGNYTIYLPPQQQGLGSPPSPSPGRTVTTTTTVTVTTTETEWIPKTTVTLSAITTKEVWTEVTTTLSTTTTTETNWVTVTTITNILPVTTITTTQPATITTTITNTQTVTEKTNITYTSTKTTYYTTTTSTETAALTTYTATATTTSTETLFVTKYVTKTITTFPTETTSQVPVEEPEITTTLTITSYITEVTTTYYTVTSYKFISTTTKTYTNTVTAYKKTATTITTRATSAYTTAYLTTVTVTITRATAPTTVTNTITSTVTTTTTSTKKTEITVLSLTSTIVTTTTALSETTVTTTRTITETTYRTTTLTTTEVVLPMIYSIWFQVIVRDNRGIIVESMTYEYLDFKIEREFVLPASVPVSQWWNTNYQYRRQIVISAGSVNVPSGYTVGFTCDTASLISSGKLRSDGKDWRIVYWSGTSWIELDRHVTYGTFNTASTKTWFKTQAPISAGNVDGNYYVYYGYSSETTNPPSALENVYNPPKDANTVILWYCKEGTGNTVVDSSGNGWTGTLDGSVSWVSNGKYGTALDFQGSAELRSANALLGNVWTVEAWVYVDSINTGQDQFIFEHGAWPGMALGFMRSTNLKLSVGGARNGPSTSFTTGTWHHIAATYDGTAKLYVDGELKASMTTGFTDTQYDSKMAVGIISGWAYAFDGRIECIRVSNIARTSFPYVIAQEPITMLVYYPEELYEIYNVEVMYSALSGTQWFWHGHKLTIYPIERKPIPPIPIKFIRVNITKNGYSNNESDLLETVSQVEEWSEDLRKPLYVYEKDQTSSRFGKTSKLVFNIVFPADVKDQKVRIWWKDDLEAPPPAYGIKLSVERDFVIIDNGIYKLQLLAKKGYSTYIDWSISLHYNNYHAEVALYGYGMREIAPGSWWYPEKIPAGDWDWPIVYGPVRAIAYRYTNIVYNYVDECVITDELLHEMYIIVPYNVSYFLWIMNGTWLKNISIKYLTAIMMISGNSTDIGNPIRVNNWAYRTNFETIKESPPTFNDMVDIGTKNYSYWSAQYREGFGAAIFLSEDTLNLLKDPYYEHSSLHIFTSGDNARRVIDYSPEDSDSSSELIMFNGMQYNLYAAVRAYDGEYNIPELWYRMFVEQFYPKVWAFSSEY